MRAQRRQILFAEAGFTPRQLFSALQGAWLEPVQGSIWQENTGVTPTTAGGQTIGRIADQSGGGNNATQATAGNRPAYQLDSNGLPLARHDTTDSLVVSLPNLGSGVYSASGSVYFATPVGMSALHGQSMGLTYTLPALSTDIYSWIVVPQRLNAVQENRLARYMQRKAGIAGPDYFEQEGSGAELVVNGDFSNGKTGWTFNVYDGLAVTDGVATHTSNGVSGNSSYQAVPTRIGRYYSITFTRISSAGGGLIRAGATLNGLEYAQVSSGGSTSTFTYIVMATTTTMYVSFGYGANGATTSVDNVSVYELNDGMTGQLLDDNYEPLLAG